METHQRMIRSCAPAPIPPEAPVITATLPLSCVLLELICQLFAYSVQRYSKIVSDL